MRKHIFTVEDYAWQAGDSLVVVSNLTRDDEDYRTGDILELHRPDGVVLTSKSTHVFTDPPSDPPSPVWYGLEGLTKKDVPVGTKAWLTCALPREPRKLHRNFERIEQSPSHVS